MSNDYKLCLQLKIENGEIGGFVTRSNHIGNCSAKLKTSCVLKKNFCILLDSMWFFRWRHLYLTLNIFFLCLTFLFFHDNNKLMENYNFSPVIYKTLYTYVASMYFWQPYGLCWLILRQKSQWGERSEFWTNVWCVWCVVDLQCKLNVIVYWGLHGWRRFVPVALS